MDPGIFVLVALFALGVWLVPDWGGEEKEEGSDD